MGHEEMPQEVEEMEQEVAEEVTETSEVAEPEVEEVEMVEQEEVEMNDAENAAEEATEEQTGEPATEEPVKVSTTGRKLFIGSLPFELSQAEFEEYWKNFEGIESSQLIMKGTEENKCKGFGFVTCETKESAQALIDHEGGHTIKEKTLKVELSKARPERMFFRQVEGKDEATLKAHFEQFGEIVDMMVHNKGKYGFVTIRANDEAQDLKNLELHKEFVTLIEKASKRKSGGGRGGRRGGRGRGRGRRGRGQKRGRGGNRGMPAYGAMPYGAWGNPYMMAPPAQYYGYRPY